MNLCKKNECTGCSACMSICPRNAISMKYDTRGFLRPVVDMDKCIKCNMCEKLCDKLNHHMEDTIHSKKFYLCYATKLKDEEKRLKSQSGGLFTALAERILEMNGIVYGVGIDNDNHVKHFRISKIEDLDILKGTKYVQSDIGNSFKLIINDLKENKKVLFSGTPCQVAGIESLLDLKKIDKKNFYSCDLICHGVPSPLVYEKFISFLEKKYNDKIVMFNFRDKKIGGWNKTVESFKLKKNNEIIFSTLYRDLFYSNLTLRESCEICKYSTKNRPGDLTIGDCWGIEKINPNLWNDNKEISVCLVQTEKGKELFDLAMNKLDIFELDSTLYEQPNLNDSSTTPYQKDNFWKDYNKIPFDKLLKKYTSYGGIKFKLKRKILKVMNRW